MLWCTKQNMTKPDVAYYRMLQMVHITQYATAIWNICDVTRRICINLLQFRGLLWRSLIKDALSSLKQFLATERPLKMIKNSFYFTLKALFFSKYLNFDLKLLVLLRNGLIRKIKVISKLMTSQAG